MMDGAGMGLMWIFGLLVLVGLVVLVVVLVKSFSRGSSNAGGPDHGRGPGAGPGRAREILEERYARGELSAEEYREQLRTLEDGGR